MEATAFHVPSICESPSSDDANHAPVATSLDLAMARMMAASAQHAIDSALFNRQSIEAHAAMDARIAELNAATLPKVTTSSHGVDVDAHIPGTFTIAQMQQLQEATALLEARRTEVASAAHVGCTPTANITGSATTSSHVSAVDLESATTSADCMDNFSTISFLNANAPIVVKAPVAAETLLTSSHYCAVDQAQELADETRMLRRVASCPAIIQSLGALEPIGSVSKEGSPDNAITCCLNNVGCDSDVYVESDDDDAYFMSTDCGHQYECIVATNLLPAFDITVGDSESEDSVNEPGVEDIEAVYAYNIVSGIVDGATSTTHSDTDATIAVTSAGDNFIKGPENAHCVSTIMDDTGCPAYYHNENRISQVYFHIGNSDDCIVVSDHIGKAGDNQLSSLLCDISIDCIVGSDHVVVGDYIGNPNNIGR